MERGLKNKSSVIFLSCVRTVHVHWIREMTGDLFYNTLIGNIWGLLGKIGMTESAGIWHIMVGREQTESGCCQQERYCY